MEEKQTRLSYSELRIIGISLSILSLGLAIAWFGFFWVATHEKSNELKSTPTPLHMKK